MCINRLGFQRFTSKFCEPYCLVSFTVGCCQVYHFECRTLISTLVWTWSWPMWIQQVVKMIILRRTRQPLWVVGFLSAKALVAFDDCLGSILTVFCNVQLWCDFHGYVLTVVGGMIWWLFSLLMLQFTCGDCEFLHSFTSCIRASKFCYENPWWVQLLGCLSDFPTALALFLQFFLLSLVLTFEIDYCLFKESFACDNRLICICEEALQDHATLDVVTWIVIIVCTIRGL